MKLAHHIPAMAMLCLIVLSVAKAQSQQNITLEELANAPSVERYSPDYAKIQPSANNRFEISFIMPAYCRVGGQLDTEALGGFATSGNDPQKILTPLARRVGEVYLLAQPNVVTESAGRPGMRLVVVNATDEDIIVGAADSVVAIVQEAKDESGEWRPIESLPISICGNSFHHVKLPRGEFWNFTTPRYEGPFKTQLRFRFDMRTKKNPKVLYSNEFSGSVNPEQFRERYLHSQDTSFAPWFQLTAEELEKFEANSVRETDPAPISQLE